MRRRRPAYLAAAVLAGALLVTGPAESQTPRPFSIVASDNAFKTDSGGPADVTILAGGYVDFAYPTGGTRTTSRSSGTFRRRTARAPPGRAATKSALPAAPSQQGWAGRCEFGTFGTYPFRCDLHQLDDRLRDGDRQQHEPAAAATTAASAAGIRTAPASASAAAARNRASTPIPGQRRRIRRQGRQPPARLQREGLGARQAQRLAAAGARLRAPQGAVRWSQQQADPSRSPASRACRGEPRHLLGPVERHVSACAAPPGAPDHPPASDRHAAERQGVHGVADGHPAPAAIALAVTAPLV